MLRSFRIAVTALLVTPLAAFAQQSRGSDGGSGPNTSQAYFEFQVEKPALPREGNPRPRYPASLLRRGIPGEVLAQFVVDTNGKADVSTFVILRASDSTFVRPVREIIPRLRFYPAEVAGQRVRQLVQQSFLFVARK
ncbi:MAG TPA: energy transducer TonB [Gemmatimonadaceae bacterium]